MANERSNDDGPETGERRSSPRRRRDENKDETDVDDNSDGKRMRTAKPQQKQRLPGDASDADTDEDDDLDIDPKGETKVTKDGYLLGGREYALTAFTLPRHPTRLYMFSLEASKTLSFRDTYIFFLRNTKVKRVNGTEEDREYLRQRGLLPSQLRNRAVTLVTARNLFRVFGHQVVRRGKPIRDDYFVGDLDEPAYFDEARGGDGEDDIDLSAAEFIRSLASTEGGPFLRQEVPISTLGFNNVEPPEERFHPNAIPGELLADNWMLKCALSAAEFNQRLNKYRPQRFFDLHTNIEQVPLITQPESVCVEQRESSERNAFMLEKQPCVRKSTDAPTNNWHNVSSDQYSLKYPLSIMPNQHQGALALHRERFKEQDNPYYEVDHIPPSILKQMELQQQNAAATSIFSGTVGFRPIQRDLTASVRRRPRNGQPGTDMPQSPYHHQQYLQHQNQYLPQNHYQEQQHQLYLDRSDQKMQSNDDISIAGSIDDVPECCHCHKLVFDPADLDVSQQRQAVSSDIPADILLACSKCHLKHHPSCIEFQDKTLVLKCMTYDWACSNCKLCTLCARAGDDDKLLFCDTCDRGYHMYCLSPPLEELPKGTWMCTECAVCKSCKKRPLNQEGSETMWRHVVIPHTSPKASPSKSQSRSKTQQQTIKSPPQPSSCALGTYLCTYCTDCYECFEADRFCPLCMNVYNEDSDDLAMVCCDICERWVHVGCDPELTEEMYQNLVEEEDPAFTCALCDNNKRVQLLNQRPDIVRHSPNRMPSAILSSVLYKGQYLVAPPLCIK